jgi:hypothetical protein
MKGCKYRRVSQQHKYIFLKLCITEQQSIHEVILLSLRQHTMQAFITPPPRPSSSSTKRTTKTTLRISWRIPTPSNRAQKPSRPHINPLPSISMVSRPKNPPFRSSLIPKKSASFRLGKDTTPANAGASFSAKKSPIKLKLKSTRNTPSDTDQNSFSNRSSTATRDKIHGCLRKRRGNKMLQ